MEKVSAILFTFALTIGPAFASPLEKIARQCDNNDLLSCVRLATATDGNCASPDHIGGCRFNSLNK